MPISGVLDRIERDVGHLAASEQRVARWICDHPQDVLGLTVREIAQASGSSQAAVVRLCRTLKVDGFGRLKVLLTADLVRREHKSGAAYPEISPDASFEQQLALFLQLAETSVRNTVQECGAEQLAPIAASLGAAGRILLFGQAASGIVAQDVTLKLTRLGYPALFWSDLHAALMAAALLTDRDAALMISYSGMTREVLEVATQCKRHGATVIAMTHFAVKNQLLDLADLAVNLNAIEPEPRIGATTSVLAGLVAADALLLYMANQDPERAVRVLSTTNQAILPHQLG